MASNNTNPRRRSQFTQAQETNLSAPLRKGATFHAPSTPPTEGSHPIITLPVLLQRSATCPKSSKDAVEASQRRMANILGSIDRGLYAGSKLPPIQSSDSKALDDLPLPKLILDHSLSDMIDSHAREPPQAQRGYIRAGAAERQSGQRKHHSSDSGIGSTLSGTVHSPSECSETPGSSCVYTSKIIICIAFIDLTHTVVPINGPQRNLVGVAGLGSFPSPKHQHIRGSRVETSTFSRSISIGMSPSAIEQIAKSIIRPLISCSSLKDFHSLVRDVPKGIQHKNILCLRDLEKTLIFMAPVSDSSLDGVAFAHWVYRIVKTRAKSADLYLEFCETSIRCIQATVDHISDRDQRRPTDRPYTNGYFLDLVEQIRQYAVQMAASREKQANGEDLDEMDVSKDENIRLHGGLTRNGRPAQLVRVKDGKTIPIGHSGMPSPSVDDSPPTMKRSLSEHSSDEDSVRRSMARRAKRPLTSQAGKDIALQRCGECNKEFKRPCDLTKHEKTHSRPWKCPDTTCKYYLHGWPTEKERDRHVNDKHSVAPPMYECQFTPCTYRSKRESNCKQHMEKAHNWTYVRSKTNGKPRAAINTPPTPNMPTPASTIANSFTPPTNVIEAGTDDGNSMNSFNSPQVPAFMGPPLDGPLGVSVPMVSHFNFNDYQNSAGPSEYSPAESASHQPSLNRLWEPSIDDVINASNPPDNSNGLYGQDTNIQTWNAQLVTPANSEILALFHTYQNLDADVANLSAAEIANLSPDSAARATLYTPFLPAHDVSFDEDFDNMLEGKPVNDFSLFDPSVWFRDTSNEMFPDISPSGPLYAGANSQASGEFTSHDTFSMNWDFEEE
ncbi:MAG: copper-binding transcription factor [Trizodia sp. TS-e1964]|nr:MAG: copper-binding transcription factor [Trizodia sp. TS-e1964]